MILLNSFAEDYLEKKHIFLVLQQPIKFIKMKKLLLIAFLFQASFAFSQEANQQAIYLKTFKVHGYVDGIRLDSIDAGYAKMGRTGQSVFFEYGQNEKRKDMIITDKEGLPLIFPGFSYYLFKLNFFHYNGWDVVPASDIDLLKKRE